MSHNSLPLKELSQIIERVSNPVEVNPTQYYQQIGIRSHGKGIFDKPPVLGEALGNKRVFWIEPDCFIVNIVFAWEQAVGRTHDSDVGKIASHRFPMYRPIEDKTNVDFLSYLFKTKYGKHLLTLASPGGAGRNKTLGQAEFLRIKIPYPSPSEQKRIAEILSTWDQAIETTEKLIANAEAQKKALMQQLLTGKKRLPGFSGEWTVKKLRDCTDCLDNMRIPINAESRKLIKGSIPYYGANGLQDYINKHIFNEDLVLLAEDGGYFDEFSTRPIAQLITGKSWVNNHAHVLRARSNTTTPWIFFSLVHKNILGYINGGTRAKLNKADMLQIPISLPSVEEQLAISKALDAASDTEKSLKEQLYRLKTEKTALMQQLLTGKRRVKIEEPST